MFKRMLHLLDEESSAGGGATEYYAYGEGSVKLSTSGEAELTSLRVYGADMDYSCYDVGTGAERGLGYDDGDKVKLDLRVHGRCVIDGYEFARLMREGGSPAYGGEYGEDYFIYHGSATEDYPVISSDRLMIGSTIHRLEFIALLEEDYASGGRLTPGLHIASTAFSPNAVYAIGTGVGEFSFSGTSRSATQFAGLIHKAAPIALDLPIRYDSLKLYSTADSPVGDYVGRHISVELSRPLLAIGEESDTLEAISGRVTRAIGEALIEDTGDISACYYYGYPCFKLPLPEGAVADQMGIEGYAWCYSGEEFEFFDHAFAVDEATGSIYVYIDEETTEPEDAIAELVGRRMKFILKEPYEEMVEAAGNVELTDDVSYVYVCSEKSPTLEVNYNIKE